MSFWDNTTQPNGYSTILEGLLPAASANIILVVSELGLRSSLAARLALSGACVMTAGSFGACAARRIDRTRATVVLDHAAYHAEAESWAMSLDEDGAWRGVLVLTGTDDAPADRDSRFAWAHKNDALDRLRLLLESEGVPA